MPLRSAWLALLRPGPRRLRTRRRSPRPRSRSRPAWKPTCPRRAACSRSRCGRRTASRRSPNRRPPSTGRSPRTARSRVLIEFSLPDDLRGASVLLLERKPPGERDMFMYLPELRSVKRITSRMVTGSMFGTDFSYEDFEMIEDYAEEAQEPAARGRAARRRERVGAGEPPRRRRDERLHAHPRVHRSRRPACASRPSSSRRTTGCARSRAPIARRLAEVSGLHYAPKLTLRDLVKQTETELSIEKIEVGVDIPDRLFSQTNLTKGK